MFFDREEDCAGGNRAETGQICSIGLALETKEILKNSVSQKLLQFYAGKE